MKIESIDGYGLITTTISNINNMEMNQMHGMKERIAQVLNSHKDKKLKNEYLTDDELKMIYAILHVFTKEYSSTQKSAFDNALKELENDGNSELVENPL